VPKYRKKPIVVEAQQYHKSAIHLLMTWVESFGVHIQDVLRHDAKSNEYMVKTLEGELLISSGDYLIRGIKGEFYPCKPDIFEQTYQLEV
jgi:hypothetical protein